MVESARPSRRGHRRRRTYLATGWLNVAGQGLCLGLLFAAGGVARLEVVGAWGPLALLILVGVPSALWTAFFYLQDRRAPEPARYVILSFLAGMAAASVFALPIEREIFRTDSWLHGSVPVLMLGATLIRGTLASFLIYLVIRYGFSPTRELAEPIDGMAYGAFAGSGFATITSLTYLAGHSDFTLFAVGYTAATNILMYASVGSLVGYLVGRTKFFPRYATVSHVLALIIGALLTGFYHTANEFLLLQGWPGTFWISFGVTMALSAGVLVIATAIMRRLATTAVTESWHGGVAREPVVWGSAVLLLAAGGLVGLMATRDVRFESASYGISLHYPATQLTPSLLPGSAQGASPLVATIFSGGGHDQSAFSISVATRQERLEVSAIDSAAYLPVPDPASLSVHDVIVGGRKGLRARYAYPRRGGQAPGDLPEMIWAYTDIVPSEKYTYVFTLESAPPTFRRAEWVYDGLLRSVRWTAK